MRRRLRPTISPARSRRRRSRLHLRRPSRFRRGRQFALIEKETAKTKLPADIAEAVVFVESRYDSTVIGRVGEIGLMQVRPETAAMLGFKGAAAELAKPEINIHYGVTYLAKAWRLAQGDLCRALMKYRAGHGEETMTARSVIYCNRAQSAHRDELGVRDAKYRDAKYRDTRHNDRCGRLGRAGFRARASNGEREAAGTAITSQADRRLRDLQARHGGGKPRILGCARSACPRDQGADRNQMAAHGVALGNQCGCLGLNHLEAHGSGRMKAVVHPLAAHNNCLKFCLALSATSRFLIKGKIKN
jgi:hypothetical protein